MMVMGRQSVDPSPADDSAFSLCHCDITLLGAASHQAGREQERVKETQEEARSDHGNQGQDESPLVAEQKDTVTGLSMAELRKVG